MKIDLRQVECDEESHLGFTATFRDAQERLLLAYPEVSGLRFVSTGGDVPQWRTDVLCTQPLDMFVLNPEDEISFTFTLERGDTELVRGHWRLGLLAKVVELHYEHSADPSSPSCRELFERRSARGSRLYRSTPWAGRVLSDAIPFGL